MGHENGGWMNDDQRSAAENGGIGPFPQEPAPGSPEAVEQAAETIRGLSPEPERPAHTWNSLLSENAALQTKVELEVALLRSTLKSETSLKEDAQRQRDALADALVFFMGGTKEVRRLEAIRNEPSGRILPAKVSKALDLLRVAGRL